MSESIPRVGFWPRFAATAIDYVVIVGLCAIPGAIVGGRFNPPAAGEWEWTGGLAGDPYIGALAGVIAFFAVAGALYMSLEAWTDATLGKRVLGLAVAGEDGRPAGSGVRTARYLVKNCHLLLGSAASLSGVWLVGTVTPLATLVVVAGSMMMLTGERRALHDVVAGTAVIKRPAPPISS